MREWREETKEKQRTKKEPPRKAGEEPAEMMSNNSEECKNLKMKGVFKIPGGPVVRTPCFHCRGPRFNPGGELRSLPCGAVKKRKS